MATQITVVPKAINTDKLFTDPSPNDNDVLIYNAATDEYLPGNVIEARPDFILMRNTLCPVYIAKDDGTGVERVLSNG